MTTPSPLTEDVDKCGVIFGETEWSQIEACSFYVEGVGMAILGTFAIVTNIFSIYVFVR